MKQLLLLLACTGAFAQADIKNFKGTIKNNTQDSIYVQSMRGNKTGFALDKNGSFAALYQPGMNMFELQYGTESLHIYLTNNTDLTITADANNFEKTLSFAGKGADENNFLIGVETGREALKKKYAESGTEEAVKADVAKLVEKWKNDVKDKKFDFFFKNFTSGLFMKTPDDLTSEIMGDLKKNAIKGKMSPQFTYENIKGGATSLESLKGKYVYIDVWATWCGPCRAEIPDMKKIQEKYKDKNITFVSISIDKLKDMQKWKDLVAKEDLQGVQLIADADWKSEFMQAYAVESIPRFILLDKDGKVIDADAPRPSEPELEELLKKLIK